jgi:hypothetical protein
MRIWPRRKLESPPPPVVLPSLDRLAGLIERVVELVDEVSGAPVAAPPGRPPAERTPAPPPALSAPPQPAPEPSPEPSGAAADGAVDGAWFAFVASPQGYQLVDLPGARPAPGDELAVDGVRYRVLRDAPSPLPGDRRRCVVMEMEEPPEPERTPDA